MNKKARLSHLCKAGFFYKGRAMKRLLRKFYWREESGVTGIEYSLIAAGVSLAIIFIVFLFGDRLFELFEIIEGVLYDINSGP
jgi:Flp pilus assembly pilin Flp